MKINKELIDKLNSFNISVDEIVYLYSLHLDLGWDVPLIPASLLKLRRYKYLDERGNITAEGENVLLNCIEFEPITIPKVNEDRFDEIWLTFPIDDRNGAHPKTRQIRYNKVETRKAYENALFEKTHEELLTALQNELEYRKQNESADNLLKYMYISYNWFSKQGYNNNLIPTPTKVEYGKSVI